ncbi:MAG: hypothetical protein ACO1RX_07815 [Candidatus Sericytochromatia bacterium]
MHFSLRTLGLATALWLGLTAISGADVQNVDYNQRELEIQAEGNNAEAALSACEIQALEEVIQGLVHTEEERGKYARLREQLIQNRARYLKRLQILGKGTTEQGGRYYRIRFQVQVGDLRKDLQQAGVILSAQALSEQLSHPTIAAYYRDPREQGEYAQWSVARINHFLLEHAFKVVDAAVWQELTHDDQLIQNSQGSTGRMGQLMGTQARADVLLEIEVNPQIAGHSGDYTYIQTPVRVKAYESSSGEPFITKIYQRMGRDGQPEALAIKGNIDVSAKVVIEEAVAGVMPMVLEDLTRHWKQSLALGQQYRLVFKDLAPARQPALQKSLGELVKDLKLQEDGSYLVRYKGPLNDLADTLETRLGEQMGFSTEAFDLGNAYFLCR